MAAHYTKLYAQGQCGLICVNNSFDTHNYSGYI